MAGNFAGDIGGMFRRVKGGGIRPDEPESFADFFIGQIGEPDAKRARVGKWQVGFALLRKVGVNLKLRLLSYEPAESIALTPLRTTRSF